MATPFGPQLVGETEKALGALLRNFLEGTGLSEPQWVTLRLADLLEGAVDARGLAEALTSRAQFHDAADLVSALSSRGLLADGRLTPAGRSLMATVQAEITSATSAIWDRLPTDSGRIEGRDMDYTTSFLLLGSLYLLAAASPGPNFFIISQLALNGRIRQARRVAIGIAVGSTVWAIAAVLGLAAMLGTFEHLSTGLRVAGALYLAWYGVRLLRGAPAPTPAAHSTGPSETAQVRCRTGVFTSLTNPKSAAFWSSVFASTLPNRAPAWFLVSACCLIAALSASWHLALAAVFARPRLQTAYISVRRPIEAICGSALVALGLLRVVAR